MEHTMHPAPDFCLVQHFLFASSVDDLLNTLYSLRGTFQMHESTRSGASHGGFTRVDLQPDLHLAATFSRRLLT